MTEYVAVAAGLWLLPIALVVVGYGAAAMCPPARGWLVRQLFG